jgi:hypothetical protein
LSGNGRANGLVIENADQPGARVYTQELRFGFEPGVEHAVIADGLTHTDIQMHGACVIVTGTSPAITVVGIGRPGTGRVALFGAMLGMESQRVPTMFDVVSGGRLFVQDAWYEAPGPETIRLAHEGTFTFWNGHLSARQNSPAKPYVTLDGFNGDATFSGVALDQLGKPGHNIEVANETGQTRALFLGITGQYPDYFYRRGFGGQIGFTLNTWDLPGDTVSLRFLPERGETSVPFVRTMLAQARATQPASPTPLGRGITDVRIQRVLFKQTPTALHVKSGS